LLGTFGASLSLRVNDFKVRKSFDIEILTVGGLAFPKRIEGINYGKMSAPRTKNAVPAWIENPYPHLDHSLVSFPAKHVLLVTINRPEFMNCLPVEATIELGALWKWYDAEPELRCAVFTGV
jgi:hypothetical protein